MTPSSSRAPFPPAANAPSGSPPHEPAGASRSQRPRPDEAGEGAWLLLRLIGGFVIGFALLQLMAHFDLPLARAILRSSGVTDGVAVLLGLGLIEGAVRTRWGSATERAVRRFIREHRSTRTLVRY